MLKEYLHRVAERQKSLPLARRRSVFKILHHPNGMKLSWLTNESEAGEKVVAWEETVKIEAFKRDLYSVDLMCLAVLCKDNTTVEIDEEMEGWESLVEKLPEYLRGCKKFADWFEAVAFPAFKPNLTVIYQRGEEDTLILFG